MTLTALIAGAIVLLLAMTVTAAIGFARGQHTVVDISWGLGFVLVAISSAIVGDGSLWRRWLFVVLIGVWGIRLATHIGRRAWQAGEDPRYEELLSKSPDHPVRTAIVRIYLTQGLAQFFVSLPIMLAVSSGGGLSIIAIIGVLLWIVGVVFEGVGDEQLRRYKADPDRKPIMDRGLWAWTRHPNYFGDACVWWGIYIVAAASGLPALFTIASPVVMTYFLVFATGAKLLERHMEQRPGYREYQARTSYFIPLPPRTGAQPGGPKR